LSLIAGMLKSFGMVSYKVSVPRATPAPSKPRKTPKATTRTDGQISRAAKIQAARRACKQCRHVLDRLPSAKVTLFCVTSGTGLPQYHVRPTA
jgi:hypothetical protein